LKDEKLKIKPIKLIIHKKIVYEIKVSSYLHKLKEHNQNDE